MELGDPRFVGLLQASSKAWTRCLPAGLQQNHRWHGSHVPAAASELLVDDTNCTSAPVTPPSCCCCCFLVMICELRIMIDDDDDNARKIIPPWSKLHEGTLLWDNVYGWCGEKGVTLCSRQNVILKCGLWFLGLKLKIKFEDCGWITSFVFMKMIQTKFYDDSDVLRGGIKCEFPRLYLTNDCCAWVHSLHN